MKLNVHTMFLNQISSQYHLLFLRECFLFEEHVEYLIPERVIVDRDCNEQYQNNRELGNHNSIVSPSCDRASVKNDLRRLAVG